MLPAGGRRDPTEADRHFLPARAPPRTGAQPRLGPGTLTWVDDIAFNVERDSVVPIVNGVDLREMFGRPALLGFSARMLPPSGELFGEQAERGEDGRLLPEALPVLVCGCGEAGCGSVTIRVSTDRDQVVWSDFSDFSPENGAVPMSFGPFRFDRSSYSRAVGAAARAWRRESRHVSERLGQ